MKLLWTYLSPPYNKGFLFIQIISFIFLAFLSLNFVKISFKQKLNFETENYNEVNLGLILWSVGCLLSSFFLRQVMENRYYLYSSLIFYMLLIPFLRASSVNKKYLNSLLIGLSLIHFFFNLFISIGPLKNLYLERRFNYLNFKTNYMANFYPTEEVRNQAIQIKKGEVDLLKERIFEIPSGINGGEPSHLKVFNEFVPISLQLIKFDENKDIHLGIENLVIQKSFSFTNDSSKGLRKIIAIILPHKPLFDVYFVKLKSNSSVHYFQLKEDANNTHQIEIYSNQIPDGHFTFSLMKGSLALKTSQNF